MAPAKAQRNRELRRSRRKGSSLRSLAAGFGISAPRVVKILEATGGDPLYRERLATTTEDRLRWEQDRLMDRIRNDLNRLLAIETELEVRERDRMLGLT